MELDTDKIDQAILALLALGRHEGNRAWKAFDWEWMGRLHAKGLYHRPRQQGEVGALHRGRRARVAPAGCRTYLAASQTEMPRDYIRTSEHPMKRKSARKLPLARAHHLGRQ
jgi:hypothetical protein